MTEDHRIKLAKHSSLSLSMKFQLGRMCEKPQGLNPQPETCSPMSTIMDMRSPLFTSWPLDGIPTPRLADLGHGRIVSRHCTGRTPLAPPAAASIAACAGSGAAPAARSPDAPGCAAASLLERTPAEGEEGIRV